MDNNKISLILVTLSIIFLSGCTSMHIDLPSDYWDGKDKTIGIAVMELPNAGAFKAGNQGLLDMAINEALAGSLEEHLQTLDASSFLKIQNKFNTSFKIKGIKTVNITNNYNYKNSDIKIYKNGKKGYSGMDISQIVNDYKVDQIMLFFVKRFGTIRKYYGFIPLSNPDAICECRGILIDVRTNEIYWNCDMKESESIVYVSSNWNEPPDFPDVTSTLETAIDESIDYLYNDFLKNTYK